MADPSALGNNPFAALSAIAGPAILTNACSVLALGTSNRLGRVVDRTRAVFRELSSSDSKDREHSASKRQLEYLEMRAQMLLKALRSFYAALGMFATSALMSALSSVFAAYEHHLTFQVTAVIALISGVAAVVSLGLGCAVMVRETRIAVRSLEEEATQRVL